MVIIAPSPHPPIKGINLIQSKKILTPLEVKKMYFLALIIDNYSEPFSPMTDC